MDCEIESAPSKLGCNEVRIFVESISSTLAHSARILRLKSPVHFGIHNYDRRHAMKTRGVSAGPPYTRWKLGARTCR